MNNLQLIQDNETYKQVLRDSCGGVLYNLANRNKYDTKELLELWHSMSESEQSAAGGIVKGAMNFLEGN